LRSIPVAVDMAEDMKEYCPGALLLNYVNPMAMVCWALGTTGIEFVGLCHGVQTTLDLISGYVDVPKSEIDYLCAGINHMGWFLRIEHKGRDLYPLLRQRFEQPEYYVNEKVRGEVFRHFGYFMTTTGHLSEYVPYFRKNQKALDHTATSRALRRDRRLYNWCPSQTLRESRYPGGVSARSAAARHRILFVHHRSDGAKASRLNGNVVNGNMISNLARLLWQKARWRRSLRLAQDRRRHCRRSAAPYDQRQRAAPRRKPRWKAASRRRDGARIASAATSR
jgi:alpha-galactosidase